MFVVNGLVTVPACRVKANVRATAVTPLSLSLVLAPRALWGDLGAFFQVRLRAGARWRC